MIAGMHRSGLRLVCHGAEAGGPLQLKLDDPELLISASRLLCAHVWQVLKVEGTMVQMEIYKAVTSKHLKKLIGFPSTYAVNIRLHP